MAENDDDEGFGDFRSSVDGPRISSKNNIPNAEDDDWGDFINSSFHSRTGSLPAEQLNPFGGISSAQVEPDSMPNGEDSAGTGWGKPIGAIPLSIFGEEEREEEGSGAMDQAFNGANGLLFSTRKADNAKTKQLDLKELMCNLYKQNLKSNDVSGPESGSSESVPDPKHTNEQDLHRNGLNRNLNGKHEVNFSSNGSILKWDELNLVSNGLNSNIKTSSLDGEGANLDSNLFNQIKLSSGGFAPTQNGFKLDPSGIDSSLADGDVEVDDDGDDDGWEFKAAESKAESGSEIFNLKSQENIAQNGSMSNFIVSNFSLNVLGEDANGLNSNVNGINLSSADKNEEFSDDGWEFKTAESETSSRDDSVKVDERVQEHPEGAEYTFGFGNGTNGATDLFATSGGISDAPYNWGSGFSFNPSSTTQSKHDSKNNGFNTSTVAENIDSDKTCWAFNDVFSETESKDKKNEGGLEKHDGALPLSIFGDVEPETDDPLTYPDVSTHKPTPLKVGMKDSGSNMSIKDLISTLYSRVEQDASIIHRDSPNENGYGSTKRMVASDTVNSADGFDDNSWEFKGVFFGSGDQNQKSALGVGDSSQLYPAEGKINDFVDFYSKLTDELCFVALFHVDGLKKVQSSAPAGEDGGIERLEKEIQDLCNVMHKDGTKSKEIPSENDQSRCIFLNEFTQILQEEQFQVLESEYHLSEKLPLAGKDLQSATELLKHAASTLKILRLGSIEEQYSYVSTWFQIVSACAEELKHGSLLWEQSLEKNIDTQILTIPQGRQYIHALGEIYRVIEVIGLSAKLFKPWILFSSADSIGIFDHLRECSTLWSNSGLQDACQSMSDPVHSDSGAIKALLDSIMNSARHEDGGLEWRAILSTSGKSVDKSNKL
ncbi:hypothetical protein SLE2022_082420 [Rubroshorea leprosula]